VGVGASGAIMGLMGGYLGYCIHVYIVLSVCSEVLMTWDRTDPNLRKLNLIQIVVVVAITLAISFSPYVDMGAHLGKLHIVLTEN
jgi:membrane associated rhomboid family serine protease